MKKFLKTTAASLLCLGILGTNAVTHSAWKSPKLQFNGKPVESYVYIQNSTLYAPLREICESAGASVYWNQTNQEAYVTHHNKSKSFSTAYNCTLINGRLYAPIRMISSVLDKNVSWNKDDKVANIYDQKNINSDSNDSASYTQDELFWLARIIHAEAQGESMDGKIGVGNVILNRIASNKFPNTIYDVIFDRNYGVQFTPVSNGAIYCTPSEESYEAARRVLEGENIVGDSLYFFNPSIAQSFWIAQNCTYVTTIGEHQFYV